MRHKFHDKHISMCKRYMLEANPTKDEVLNIDGVYQLQIWFDKEVRFSAIYNTITKEWIYI